MRETKAKNQGPVTSRSPWFFLLSAENQFSFLSSTLVPTKVLCTSAHTERPLLPLSLSLCVEEEGRREKRSFFFFFSASLYRVTQKHRRRRASIGDRERQAGWICTVKADTKEKKKR